MYSIRFLEKIGFFNLDLEYRNIEYQLLDQVSNLKPNYLLCDLV